MPRCLWASASTLAAGLAGINAISNLIGGALRVNVVGLVKEWTGSFVLGMLPLALLCAVAAVSVIILGAGSGRGDGQAMILDLSDCRPPLNEDAASFETLCRYPSGRLPHEFFIPLTQVAARMRWLAPTSATQGL